MAETKWYRNTQTGMEWEVSQPDLARRLDADVVYQTIDAPEGAASQNTSPGGAVHSVDVERGENPLPPPGTRRKAKGENRKAKDDDS